eukprot:m.129174 g.129174  ORF g.129174 m.129174 type:complete len:353 (+) comp29378_c0_seq1:359-1417(+)
MHNATSRSLGRTVGKTLEDSLGKSLLREPLIESKQKLKVVVTGFDFNPIIGTKILDALATQPTVQTTAIVPVAPENAHAQPWTWLCGDVSKFDPNHAWVKQCVEADILIHCATATNLDVEWPIAARAMVATSNVLLCARHGRAKRIVILSSIDVITGYLTRGHWKGLIDGVVPEDAPVKPQFDCAAIACCVAAESMAKGMANSDIGSSTTVVIVRVGYLTEGKNSPKSLMTQNTSSTFRVQGLAHTENWHWTRKVGWISNEDFQSVLLKAATTALSVCTALTVSGVSCCRGSPYGVGDGARLIGFRPSDDYETYQDVDGPRTRTPQNALLKTITSPAKAQPIRGHGGGYFRW